MDSAEGELESMLSDEKAVALQSFFSIMGALIQQEGVKLETMKHQSRKVTNFKPDLRKLGSSKVDVNTKPTITLYYESSWEYAYLHYSTDSSGWTELPGVCMRNDIATKGHRRRGEFNRVCFDRRERLLGLCSNRRELPHHKQRDIPTVFRIH